MSERPGPTAYYLGLAVAVAMRSECRGLRVGAVLVRENRVVSTGYNGTPEGWENCTESTVCPRCANRDEYGSGTGYDACICVHAEANAVVSAARSGVSVDGSTAFVTHQPCLTCAKDLVQVGVSKVFYLHALEVAPGLKEIHQRLMGQLNAIAYPLGQVTDALGTITAQYESSNTPEVGPIRAADIRPARRAKDITGPIGAEPQTAGSSAS